jgi:hypothetical protein
LRLAVLVAISRCVGRRALAARSAGGACGGWLAAALGIQLAARVPIGLHPAAQWCLSLVFAGCALALLAGYDTGYPQALWLERALGALALLAFGLTFVRPRRSGAAPG